MTINLTDPANHPANGPLTVERITRVRDELQRTMFYANGGVMDHIVADAIKGLEELMMSREAVPVAWMHDGEDGREYNGHNEFSGGGKGLPLYTAPPAPVIADGWIQVNERMPEDRVSVVLWVVDGEVTSGHYSHKTQLFYHCGEVIESEISHWMAVEAPQEVK